MNKKIFIKNRPFDVNDANDMQNWTEDALKKTMASIYSSGIVEGLNVTVNTLLKVNVNIGKAFDTNYDFINVSANQVITLDAANTSPRIDKIVIKYVSSTTNNVDTGNVYGLGTSLIYSQNKLDTFIIQVVKGTPAASPVAPATPAGTLPLAQVAIAANATSLTAGNITDLRQFIAINSNINRPEVVISGTTPSDTNVLWLDSTNNEAKIYKNSVWTILDSKDADTLDGQHGSYYSPATHNHDTVYAKKVDVYTQTESDTNFLSKADNLSSLADKTAARTNLGLGTMATQSTSSFAPSTHNHNTLYVKGNYTLSIGTSAPAANSTTIWWDTTTANQLKRHNGTAWVALDANDAATLEGASKGTGANNILQLNSSGKVPDANISSTFETTSGAQTKADAAETAAINYAKSFGVGAVAKNISGTDLNSLTSESGLFRGNSLANAPDTDFWYIINMVYSSTYVTQLIFDLNNVNTDFRMRTMSSGTWGSWKKMATDSPATTLANGLMTSTMVTKLNGIADNAEVNQNTFANIKVGSSTIASDSKTDTLEFVAGNGVTLAADTTNDKVTISTPNAIQGGGQRVEVATATFFTNGASPTATANVTFNTPFNNPPTIMPANTSNVVAYGDALRYPHIYNITTTGFSVRITAIGGNLGTSTPTNMFMNFMAFGN